MDLQQPARPPLLPQRRSSSLVAEYLGAVLTVICFVGMLITLRYVFSGPDWECSGDGCFEEFDRLRSWTFPIPLFPLTFITTFGFVGSLLLYLWGRGGRVPTFEAERPAGRPALKGVARTLTWVALLEIALGIVFLSVGQWLTGGILGTVGAALFIGARATAASSERADRLLRSGYPAIGEVTAVERTGASLNDNPQMKITMTVIQNDTPVSAVMHKEYVPLHHLGRLQIGARLPIKIDPLDSNNVVIEWGKQASGIEA